MRFWGKKGDERRGGGRRSVAMEAAYRVMDAITRGPVTAERPGRVSDISQQGCRLELVDEGPGFAELKRCLAAPNDYLVELSLRPATGGTWRLAGKVRWIHPAPGGFGLGIRFEDPVTLPSFWQKLLTSPAGLAPAAPPMRGAV